LKWLEYAWSGIVIAILVPCLIARILGVLAGLVWRRRRTRSVFYDRLRQAGLSEREAIELTAGYHPRISLRELVSFRWPRRASS